MSAPLLTVVGGTGTQGLSLINAALKDGSYRVRALTRNTSSDKAKELRDRGVETVQADVNDQESLLEAFKGSTAIFGMTDFFEPFTKFGPEKAVKIETAQGINIAKAASKTATLKHFIWSTLPNAAKVTDGKYKIPHFVAKNNIDDHIKSDADLLSKTTFLWITFYGNNFQYPVFTPSFLKSTGKYIHLSPAAPDTPIKTIGSPLGNVGIFGLAILKQPHITLPGRFVIAHIEDTTAGDMLKKWGSVLGKEVAYVQTPLEDFSPLWPHWGLEMGAMMKMWSEIKEKSWSGEEGLLTKDDLGLGSTKFVSFQDAVRETDWTTLL